MYGLTFPCVSIRNKKAGEGPQNIFMDIQPDEAETVNSETDNLDTFSDLFHEKEVAEVSEPESKEEAPEVVEDLAPETVAVEESDEDDLEDQKAEDKPKKTATQKRIDDLTAKYRETERKLRELEAKQSTPEAPKPVVVTKDDTPQPDNKNEDGSDKYPLGEFDPSYIRDLTRHTIKQEQAEFTKAQEAEKAERQNTEVRTQLQEQWLEKVSDVGEKYEDFDTVVQNLEDTFTGLDPSYSDYLANAIKAMDNGPDVLYYLANNLEEAKKFVAQGPLQATMALGRYQAMLASESNNKQKEIKLSRAPVPPQVNKGSKGRASVAHDTDDLAAFEKEFFKRP